MSFVWSYKDRKAMYMKQVQVVSTTPIKSSHLMNANQDKEQPNTLVGSRLMVIS